MPVTVTNPTTPLPEGTPLQRRLVTIGGDYDDTQLVLGAVDELGSLIYCNDLVGWDGAIGTTLSTQQKANDDGAWYTDAFLPPRVMSAECQVIARSSDDLLHTLRLLAHRVPVRTAQRMVVTEEQLQLQADVIQNGDLLATRKGNTARVSIPLLAPDPRRYAVDAVVATTGLPATTGGIRLEVRAPFRVVAVAASGVITVENAGNISTRPVFTVTGPCPPFTLTHLGSGRTLRFHEPVPAGRTLTIDTDSRTVLLEGEARYLTGVWFDYLPGVNQVAFSAESAGPDAALTSTHRSAWK